MTSGPSRPARTLSKAGVLTGGLAAGVAAYLLVGRVRHYEWLMFAVWAALLAPTIAIALRRARNTAAPPASPVSILPWIVSGAVAFLFFAAALNFHFRPVTINPDETAYRFQARVFASGRLMAEPPWVPDDRTAVTPLPLRYNHHIYRPQGWFVKYPVFFPAVLAAGQLAGLGWLVNPLLGAALVALTALLARNVFEPSVAILAVLALLLSPYVLANSIGWMSHPLCAVLLAGAFYCCFRGADSRRFTPFLAMLALLALAYHARPFTAFLATAILAPLSLWTFRRDRRRLASMLALLIAGGACIVGSVLVYNWAFTGSPLLSPYALYRGAAGLNEIDLSLATLLDNALSGARLGLQGTTLASLPFLPLLALYGLWRFRLRSPKVWALAAFFPLLVLGYAFNPISSGSWVGERFWFEGFFGLAILGAAAAADAGRRLAVPRSTAWAVLAALTMAQVPLGARLIQILDERTRGYAAVTAAAGELRDCRCAVFLDLDPPYLGQHLNLNDARWREAQVFFFIDPGPAQREPWARRLGFDRWKVLAYDATAQAARVR